MDETFIRELNYRVLEMPVALGEKEKIQPVIAVSN